jgi:rubrerythrin
MESRAHASIPSQKASTPNARDIMLPTTQLKVHTMEKVTRSPAIIILVATLVGLGFCLWKITQNPAPNEALLLSLFMTVLSVLASWIISRHYAKASYEDNLKVFALKAAEKVNNLSNELNRLSAFLQKALEDDDFASPTEELATKTVRFEDAIHLITALKSFNDTSLSDWRSIIGQELSEQREAELEAQEEREDRLREIVERLDHVEAESAQSVDLKEKLEGERLRKELAVLRADMRVLASQVGGVQIKVPKRKKFERPCPICGNVVEYIQNAKNLNTKGVECTGCGSRLYAQSEAGDSVLMERKNVRESLQCPSCGTITAQDIDPLFGTMHEYVCFGCHAPLRAVRTRKGFNIKIVNSEAQSGTDIGLTSAVLSKPMELTDSLLEKVTHLMGPQPWPKGRSSEVRAELGVSKFVLDCAIERLISRGVFKPQFNGVLYAPIDASSKIGASAEVPNASGPDAPQLRNGA